MKLLKLLINDLLKTKTMTLKKFTEQYDVKDSIVLLEGKRVVLKEDINKLTALGKLLATKTKNILFRSGNAIGSDLYFSKGVAEVDKNRLEVITPYLKHREKYNLAGETHSMDEIDLVSEENILNLSKLNKKTEKLVDKYASGERDRFTIKAAYIIRDTIKATGIGNIKSAKFGIFYDDLENPNSGGTGHTMNICIQKNIPLINQKVWFKWLN